MRQAVALAGLLLLAALVSGCPTYAMVKPGVETVQDEIRDATTHLTTQNQLLDVDPRGGMMYLNVTYGIDNEGGEEVWLVRPYLTRQAGYPLVRRVVFRTTGGNLVELECAPSSSDTSLGRHHNTYGGRATCDATREVIDQLAASAGVRVRFEGDHGAEGTIGPENARVIREVIARSEGRSLEPEEPAEDEGGGLPNLGGF